MQNYDDLSQQDWKDWGKWTPASPEIDESVPMARPHCEHHWVSTHQPDFPKSIFWIEVCSICDDINGAALTQSVQKLEYELERLRRELRARGLGHVV